MIIDLINQLVFKNILNLKLYNPIESSDEYVLSNNYTSNNIINVIAVLFPFKLKN